MLECVLQKEGVLREALKDNTGIDDAVIYFYIKKRLF